VSLAKLTVTTFELGLKKTVVGVIETAFEWVLEIMKDKNIKEKNFIYFLSLI
jgi:hypothetical protein